MAVLSRYIYIRIKTVLKDVDAVIWCATGFSQKKNANPIEKIKGIAELALKRTIDVIALPNIAKQVKLNEEQKQQKEQFGNLPRVVMLSSAGVTRPSWDEKKKALMPGAADIPIVRLNPFGALDVKRESEEKLRETGMYPVLQNVEHLLCLDEIFNSSGRTLHDAPLSLI